MLTAGISMGLTVAGKQAAGKATKKAAGKAVEAASITAGKVFTVNLVEIIKSNYFSSYS